MAKMYINRTWDSDLEDYHSYFNVISEDDDLDWIESQEDNGPIFEVSDELADEYNLVWAKLNRLENQIEALEPEASETNDV